MEHERGGAPSNDFKRAEAEVKAQQSQREERLAREGDSQVAKPLQRGNKQHSAVAQEVMEDNVMERELDAIDREAHTVIT